jgi:hypothetical protein
MRELATVHRDSGEPGRRARLLEQLQPRPVGIPYLQLPRTVRAGSRSPDRTHDASMHSRSRGADRGKIRDGEAELGEANVVRLGVRTTGGRRQLPLEKIDARRLGPARIIEDPRVPLPLAREAEGAAVLRLLGSRVRACLESDDLLVERLRARQIRAVDVAVNDAQQRQGHAAILSGQRGTVWPSSTTEDACCSTTGS